MSAQTPDEALAGAVIAAKPVAQAEVAPAAELDKPANKTLQPAADPIQIAREVEDLRGLLSGVLPQHLPLQSLFEIDLADPSAVALRREALARRVAAVVDAQLPPAEPISEIAILRRERDRLRLAFLNLPDEQRAALIEQDRLLQDGRALEKEEAESTTALAASEQAREAALAAASAAETEAERWVATEEARLLAHRSEPAVQRQAWVTADQERIKGQRELLARYADVDGKSTLSAAQADKLYASIREDLKNLRDQASVALDKLNAPSLVANLDAATAPAVGSNVVSVEARAPGRAASGGHRRGGENAAA